MSSQPIDSQTLPTLIRAMVNFQASHYFSLAGATALFYDYILCLTSGTSDVLPYSTHTYLENHFIRGQLMPDAPARA